MISYSQPLHFVMQAAEELEREEGITAHVLDLRTLQPLDREAIIASRSSDRQSADRTRR
ncbi:transketolase C-terminal domain-containing protein [Paenibacillus amylolyticus]|nr:transketolase C-terminal domain-containing protein [Paenibacillus amylolyticus]